MEKKPPSPLSTPDPWDLVSAAYTSDLLEMFLKFSASALDLANVQSGQRVLDVATGPGTLALLAAGRGAKVTALDFSRDMLDQLEKRQQEMGIKGVEVQHGDGQRLPFATESFDAAFSMFGLMFFPDRAAGFGELYRVLRPGGQAVVASWAPFTGVFKLLMDSLQAELPDIPFGGGKTPLSEPDDFAREMVSAGFDPVAIKTVEHGMTLPSAAQFWQSCERSSAPVALLRRNLGEQRWPSVAAGVRRRLETALGKGPIQDSGRAYLGQGTKGAA